jgi:hypothetical protein
VTAAPEPTTAGTVAFDEAASTPAQTATEAPPAEPSPTSTTQATESGGPTAFTLGETARGTPIEVFRFGDGPQKLVFAGGLAAGFSPSTETLARQAVEHFTSNPDLIPEVLTVYFVPSVSPDTPFAPGEFRGRLNSRGVDVNRNWDCDWTADPLWEGVPRPGSGGTAPFSEAESRLLRDFILSENPAAVVIWYARATNGLVSPGGCGVAVAVSQPPADLYGAASGYKVANFGDIPGAVVNGDATNWLDSIGIPAISVLLPSLSTVDWQNNLNGILAVMAAYAERPIPPPISLNNVATVAPPPSPTANVASCPVAVAGRWQAFWNANRDRLGCAGGAENRPNAAFQYFERGTTIWRQDADRIYVLYDNGAFASYRDDSPGDYHHSNLLKGGFGYLWNNNETVRNGLGQPSAEESGAEGFTVQDFTGGALFTFFDNGEHDYALFFDDGAWISP